MAKKFIFGTDVIPQKLRFLAEEYHRHHLDTHIQAVTLYRVSERMDGSGGIEWLLTRFRTAGGTASSAMLLVEEEGGEEYLTEYYSSDRRRESTMIEAWKAFVEEEDDDLN